MSYLIALSAGHGMETPGKRTPHIPEIGREIRENEFNRAVVFMLDGILKRCGFETLLVAPTDFNTPLKERTDLANKRKAKLYFSVHYNASDGKFDENDPEGFSIHIYPGSTNGRKVAEAVLKHLKLGTPQKNRGIVESNFHELRETVMPAVLVECGFMDNKREALLMLDADFIKEVATESAKGICDYFGVKYIGDVEFTIIRGKSIIPIHSLNRATCGWYKNCISGTFQYKNVTSSMLCAWGKWKRKSSTHDWLKQPETVIFTTKKGEVKAQRALYASEIKDAVVHAVGGMGLHNWDPKIEGFIGPYADVLRKTAHTALGYNGKEFIGVYFKSATAEQIRRIMLDELKCDIAILLDGGHIASINTDSVKENLKQLQNNMIQIV